jgi:hypothetical protein
MKRFPSNSSYVFEVVGFGALCGAIHSTFRVNKHPTYMSLIGEDLLFSLKIHISFFDKKKMKKKNLFLPLSIYIQKIFHN